MSKFHGAIGFVLSKETSPGVWEDDVKERCYTGDMVSEKRRWTQSSDSTNDDLVLNHRISILLDAFARERLYAIRYVVISGTRWKVESIDLYPPRVTLSLGGIYNGPIAE